MGLRSKLGWFALGSAWIAAAACGIDEGGLMGPDASMDSSVVDVVVKDVQIDVPVACSTLDATACVTGAIPDGWTYAVAKLNASACPVGDFEELTTYASQPSALSGACICGCTASGAYSCAGLVEAGSGGGCNDMGRWIVFDAGDTSQCVKTAWNDGHIGIGPLPSPTSVGAACAPTNVGDGGFVVDTITTCTPGCSADFCGVTGFNRCIITTTQSPTEQSCPTPFTGNHSFVGATGNVSVTCSGCGCNPMPSGPCSATITPYNSYDCTGSPVVDGGFPADADCPNFGGQNNNSFTYAPADPTVSCEPTGSATGNASLAMGLTLCCLP